LEIFYFQIKMDRHQHRSSPVDANGRLLPKSSYVDNSGNAIPRLLDENGNPRPRNIGPDGKHLPNLYQRRTAEGKFIPMKLHAHERDANGHLPHTVRQTHAARMKVGQKRLTQLTGRGVAIPNFTPYVSSWQARKAAAASTSVPNVGGALSVTGGSA